MKAFVFENPPLMDTPEGQRMAEYLSRQFLKVAESITSDAQGVTWRGVWEGGIYRPYQMVTDDGWLAIPNKETTEKPAPSEQGEPFNIRDVPGTPPAWTNLQQSSVILVMGQRIQWDTSAFVRSVNYYLHPNTAGLTAEVWAIKNPTTAPEYQILVPSFVITAGDTGQWRAFPLGSTLLPQGPVYDIALVIQSRTGPTTFTADYTYLRNNSPPLSGEIRHDSSGLFMRVNKTDFLGGDRSLELANVGPGSIISAGGTTWDVLVQTDFVTYYEFEVQPQVRLGADLYTFSFTYYGTFAIDYVQVLNWYQFTTGVRGFIGTKYDPDTTPLDDNLYGVDLTIQGAVISEDWDFLAYSE